MWQERLNNKLQSFLGRLNLGSRLAKNKSSENKSNKGKANKKGDDQNYQLEHFITKRKK